MFLAAERLLLPGRPMEFIVLWCQIMDRSLINFLYKFAKPRKHCTSLQDAGMVQSVTARNFFGSILISPSEIMYPMNETAEEWNLHFSAVTNNWLSTKRPSAYLTWFWWNSRIMKNLYIIQIYKYKLVNISRRTSFTRAWKKAGVFINPNGMTRYS